jgi:hypothetical protein
MFDAASRYMLLTAARRSRGKENSIEGFLLPFREKVRMRVLKIFKSHS